jgi:hypothetical protein
MWLKNALFEEKKHLFLSLMNVVREIWTLFFVFYVSFQMLMMTNPKACFSRHSQWPPKSFRLAGLESLCCSILPWMSETFFFDKSIYYQKRRGAQPLVHMEYTRGIREREKKERKSTKLMTCGASQPVVQEKRVTRKKWRSSS